MLDVVGVVIDHVEDDADAGFVECLHHLLELIDAHLRLVGIGRIAAFGHIVVHWVVAPVILRLVKTRFVNRSIIVGRQDMHRIDSQVLQMLDGLGLSECQELAFMLQPGGHVDGEITVVHFVDDEIGGRLGLHPLVTTPSSGISLSPVKDVATLSVYADGRSKDSGCLQPIGLAAGDVNRIELAFQVALNRCRPELGSVLVLFQFDGLHGSPAKPFVVKAQNHLLGLWVGKETELGRFRRIVNLIGWPWSLRLGAVCHGHGGMHETESHKYSDN